MINVAIKEQDWKSFDEVETKPDTPYWFKLTNGNVVLAIYYSNGYCSGWAEAFFDKVSCELKHKTNTFYILSGAKIQNAFLE